MYCIYKVTNTINNKTYIGKHKLNEKLLKDKYSGSGMLLSKAYAKYGVENFKINYIEIVGTLFEANVSEKYYIAKERELNKHGCYNIADGGDGGCNVEIAKKISKTLKGRTSQNKGKHCSEETKRKMSLANKGRPSPNKGKKVSDETKRKTSESLLKYYETHNGPNKGKTPWNKGLKSNNK